MRRVQESIARHQSKFIQHPFFAQLERAKSVRRLAAFVPHLTFWVMTFQDILRINESKVTDPQLRVIARHHRVEDAGHERWFLADLAVLGVPRPDLQGIFGRDHIATRDAAYALTSEVFRAESDELRIALLLALESTGHVFFEKVAQLTESLGYTDRLKYFSAKHLEVEMAHAVFDERNHDYISELAISDETYARAAALIERIYAVFHNFFNQLLLTMADDTIVRVPEELVEHQQNVAPPMTS